MSLPVCKRDASVNWCFAGDRLSQSPQRFFRCQVRLGIGFRTCGSTKRQKSELISAIFGPKPVAVPEQIARLTQQPVVIDNALIVKFITDVGTEQFEQFYNLQTFNIAFAIKRMSKGSAVIRIYRFKNWAVDEFFIVRFQITIASRLLSLVLTSEDLRTHFGFCIQSANCNQKLEMVSLFQRILAGTELIPTRLYRKLVMETSNSEADYRLFWTQNSVDFYRLDSRPAVSARHKFLQNKAIYFQVIGKKIIKTRDQFVVLTLAEDLCGKVLYIFMYVPKSRRRFVVKFDKEVLISSLGDFVDQTKTKQHNKMDSKTALKVQIAEELIIRMYTKRDRPQLHDLDRWTALFDDNLVWEKKENCVWLFSLCGLTGIIREYLSIKMIESQEVLFEIYLDGYLNQSDIFKPYAPVIASDLRHFAFLVTLTKPRRVIRRNENINVYNFLRISGFGGATAKEVNGRFFKDLVHLLGERTEERLAATEVSFHKVNLADFKHKVPINNGALPEDPRGLDGAESARKRRQFSDRHTYVGQESFNCQIIPIFSTVFTISPRRIFSIYFNQVSGLNRRNNHLFNIQPAAEAILPKGVQFRLPQQHCSVLRTAKRHSRLAALRATHLPLHKEHISHQQSGRV